MKRIVLLCFALLALLVLGAPLAVAADTGPPAIAVALDSTPLELADSIVSALTFEAAFDPAPAILRSVVESIDEPEIVDLERYSDPFEPLDLVTPAALRELRPPPRAVRC